MLHKVLHCSCPVHCGPFTTKWFATVVTREKWARSYWDDWMRLPEQRRGRSCIRPEISRTKTFGKIGVSNGQWFEKHLKFIVLNEKFVPFQALDLSYLMKENYDKR